MSQFFRGTNQNLSQDDFIRLTGLLQTPAIAVPTLSHLTDLEQRNFNIVPSPTPAITEEARSGEARMTRTRIQNPSILSNNSSVPSSVMNIESMNQPQDQPAPPILDLSHVSTFKADPAEELLFSQLQTYAQHTEASSPMPIIASNLLPSQEILEYWVPPNIDYQNHGMLEINSLWGFLKNVKTDHSKFMNIASYLLLLITHNPQGNQCLTNFLNDMKNPDVTALIAYLTEKKTTSFQISQINNPLLNEISNAGPISQFSLSRYHVAKNILASLLYRVFQRCVRHISFSSKLRTRKDFKNISQNNEGWKYKMKAFNPLPCVKTPAETINFFKSHQIVVDNGDPSTFNYGSLSGLPEEWKEKFHNNLDDLLHFDILREFCEKPEERGFAYFYEAAHKGGIQINIGDFQEYNPITKQYKEEKGILLKTLSKYWGPTSHLSNPQTSFFLHKMSFSLYTEKWANEERRGNLMQQIPQVFTMYPKYDREWTTREMIRIDQIPTQFNHQQNVTGVYHGSLNILSKAAFDNGFNWHILEEYFENDGFYFSAPHLFMKNFVPEDEWSLYFHWNATVGNTFQLSLFALAHYLQLSAKNTLAQDVKSLSVKANQDLATKLFLEKYVHKKW